MENGTTVVRGPPLAGSEADADELRIDAIRMPATDAVQRASSGQPDKPKARP